MNNLEESVESEKKEKPKRLFKKKELTQELLRKLRDKGKSGKSYLCIGGLVLQVLRDKGWTIVFQGTLYENKKDLKIDREYKGRLLHNPYHAEEKGKIEEIILRPQEAVPEQASSDIRAYLKNRITKEEFKKTFPEYP